MYLLRHIRNLHIRNLYNRNLYTSMYIGYVEDNEYSFMYFITFFIKKKKNICNIFFLKYLKNIYVNYFSFNAK